MGLQHVDGVLTMLKPLARLDQLLGGWGIIISWLYRGIYIGRNFEMAFPSLQIKGVKVCSAQFAYRLWKSCHFA